MAFVVPWSTRVREYIPSGVMNKREACKAYQMEINSFHETNRMMWNIYIRPVCSIPSQCWELGNSCFTVNLLTRSKLTVDRNLIANIWKKEKVQLPMKRSDLGRPAIPAFARSLTKQCIIFFFSCENFNQRTLIGRASIVISIFIGEILAAGREDNEDWKILTLSGSNWDNWSVWGWLRPLWTA